MSHIFIPFCVLSVAHLIVAVILNGFDLVFVEIIIFYYRICVGSVGYQESKYSTPVSKEQLSAC